jgi:hypothetical protein
MKLRKQTVRLVLALLALLLAAGSAAPQRGKAAAPAGKTRRTAAAAVPFQEGETLDYQATWNSALTAANIRVRVVERAEFAGRMAWHYQATANTLPPVRYLFLIDDRFDSYAEAATLATLQFELYLREQKKNEDRILPFVPEGEPARGNAPAVRVPRGTCDPLAALFTLRSVDWGKSASVEMPVYDGKNLYQMRASLTDAQSQVEVPAGKFSASRVDIKIFERGKERSDVRITVWLAGDAARTPVLLEAQLPFGSVRVGLSRGL